MANASFSMSSSSIFTFTLSSLIFFPSSFNNDCKESIFSFEGGKEGCNRLSSSLLKSSSGKLLERERATAPTVPCRLRARTKSSRLLSGNISISCCRVSSSVVCLDGPGCGSSPLSSMCNGTSPAITNEILICTSVILNSSANAGYFTTTTIHVKCY